MRQMRIILRHDQLKNYAEMKGLDARKKYDTKLGLSLSLSLLAF
jgi:hypothetical protein